MKTLADLKRIMKIGQKCILLERFGELKNEEREVIKAQTNAWCFKTPFKPQTWLEIPKASLIEFDGVFIKIYGKGKRPLTAEEKAIKDGYEKIRNRKQEEIDAMTDGSQTFWQEKRYYKEHNAEYLMGGVTERGMRFDFNDNQVWDDNIKGKLELVYKLI